jgi:hypothetical protein
MDGTWVPVTCRTNDEQFKGERWPERLVCRPQRGDLVRSSGGKVLQVVAVTHEIRQTSRQEPGLEVELARPRIGYLSPEV